MKKRWLAVLAALALTAGLMAGCGSNGANTDGGNDDAEGSNPGETDLLDKIQEAGVIVVGTEGTYSPNSYHDENGDLVGFDVDVARGVADHLGVDIQFVEAEWDSLFASMDSGRVDIVVNEAEYSDERAVKYDFSEPYTYVHGALLVAEDNTDITGFDTLEGKRAAQNLTSSWGQEAEGCGAELVSVDSVAEGIELILSGRADCMLNAETAFYDYMNKHPDAPVKIVAATDTTTSSQIPVPKGNERLVEAINEALDDMRASGQLAQLSEQYFGADVTSE
ncbi:transporter substrate-binding domain-containing protein [uncultured Oscillibacter sp.]|uniref:transporter substrate-binding domain-containing protein n=1 Tax=uncultured Oscillibacter sp. TaxID=876091 RepID=UPI00280646D9|nr:transporter substrate-binding domain-containing protein [uncultured Oscillibacter sp.]